MKTFKIDIATELRGRSSPISTTAMICQGEKNTRAMVVSVYDAHRTEVIRRLNGAQAVPTTVAPKLLGR
jgi:hypothetical protein